MGSGHRRGHRHPAYGGTPGARHPDFPGWILPEPLRGSSSGSSVACVTCGCSTRKVERSSSPRPLPELSSRHSRPMASCWLSVAAMGRCGSKSPPIQAAVRRRPNCSNALESGCLPWHFPTMALVWPPVGIDRSVTVWELATGRVLAHYADHDGPVLFLDFCLDDKSLVGCEAASYSGCVLSISRVQNDSSPGWRAISTPSPSRRTASCWRPRARNRPVNIWNLSLGNQGKFVSDK